MAATKVTTKVIADDAVTIDKINDSALVTEAEGISSNDNDTTVPTSAAVKDYVDTEVAGLVDSAPATLDTLNELAAALGDDANFSTTVTNSIATKQNELTASTGIDITSDVISITDTAVTPGTYGDANNTPQITVDAQGRLTSVTTVTTAGSGSGGGGTLDIEQDTFNGDGSTVAFALTSSCDSENNLQVYIDGVYQSKDNFSVSGTTLTFTTAPSTGTANIEVMHLKSVVGSVKVDTFTGDGSDTTFDLANTIAGENNTQVFIDGVYQSKDNYSTSGTTVTFSTAPPNGSAIEVVHIVPDSAGGGGIDWETTVQTGNFTATAGAGYFVNTTSAAITVTLPSSPTAGDEVSIVDYAGTADTNNITITSSDNINGASNDVKIDYERGGVSMVYVDATQGWIAYNAANETATGLVDVPSTYNIDYLLVAGGGGGGNNRGGGGGAGGLLESTITSILPSETLSITIGAGGSGAIVGVYTSYPGSDSSITSTAISDITSYGGGAGGANTITSKTNIGSGGGGKYDGTGQTATIGQGNDGGDGQGTATYGGGGGGGAAAAGGDSTSSVAGTGGVGATTTIISTTNASTSSIGEIVSTSLYFAGGGGSAHQTSSGVRGVGGYGGGGDGGVSVSISAENSPSNTGGGGGGAAYDDVSSAHLNAGNGGSGVCILRMSTASYSGTTTGSPDVYTEGSDTILVFKTNGTYTT